jgi:hypothetical protein
MILTVSYRNFPDNGTRIHILFMPMAHIFYSYLNIRVCVDETVVTDA